MSGWTVKRAAAALGLAVAAVCTALVLYVLVTEVTRPSASTPATADQGRPSPAEVRSCVAERRREQEDGFRAGMPTATAADWRYFRREQAAYERTLRERGADPCGR